jgi:hypothetical protein
MPGLNYTLGLDSSSGIAGLSAMRGALSGFTGMIGKLGPLIGLAGGLGVAGGAVAGFKKAIDEASEMEGFEVGFKTLLGSATAATARMRDLAKFAADTPFELPEIAQASRTLETLTKGALATGKGLTLVGDVASGTQQPFGDLAVVIGRLYDGLQSGRPVGEAMARLQELGILSGDTRGAIEKLQATGAKGAGVWSLAAADLGKYSGMMKEQSGTWKGLMSTLQDGVNAVFREFGTPILPQLKPILSDGITLTEGLAVKAREWGVAVGNAIGFLRNAKDAGQLGTVAGLALRVGFSDAVDFLKKKLSGAFDGLGGKVGGMFGGLKDIFLGLGGVLSGSIAKGIAASLRDLKIGGVYVTDSTALNGLNMSGNAMQDAGAESFNAGMKKLGDTVGGGVGDFLKGVGTETAEARTQLAAAVEKFGIREMFGPTMEELKAVQAAAAAPAIAPAVRGAAEKVTPLTDRLAKIGAFIGGPGGARGEKAQMDTARHTAALVSGSLETNRLLARLDKPSGVFA